MSEEKKSTHKPTGVIESIHLHPVESGNPMIAVPKGQQVKLVTGKGIEGNNRHFKGGQRQISIIHVDLLRRLEKTIEEEFLAPTGLLTPGRVLSDMEISGDFNLIDYLDQELIIRSPDVIDDTNCPIVVGTIARSPCFRMDLIQCGLMPLMKDGNQGIFVKVIRGGFCKAGDTIQRIKDGSFIPVIKEIIFDERYAKKPANFGKNRKTTHESKSPAKSKSKSKSTSTSVPAKSMPKPPSKRSSSSSSSLSTSSSSSSSILSSLASTASSFLFSAPKTSTSTTTSNTSSAPAKKKKVSAAVVDDN